MQKKNIIQSSSSTLTAWRNHMNKKKDIIKPEVGNYVPMGRIGDYFFPNKNDFSSSILTAWSEAKAADE